MNDKNNIILTGMPGAGKSTVGNLLSKILKKTFVDTDYLIQSKERNTLQSIINEKGMDEFLKIEEKTILSTVMKDSIISTGGSVIYSEKGMKHLSSSGVVIYLKVALNEIKKRFSDMDERGVARAPGQTVDSLFRERNPLYEKYANISIDCLELTPQEVVQRIVSQIQ